MDLKGWLQSLGLQQYEAVFRKNEIDEGVLPDLTEVHLRELGFPLSARLKILKAIGTLYALKHWRCNLTQLPNHPNRSPPPNTERSADKSPWCSPRSRGGSKPVCSTTA